MNKCAIITAFLGETRNRYMVYQGNRGLAEKFAMLSRIPGADGVELCYPIDFENPAELAELLKRHGVGVAGISIASTPLASGVPCRAARVSTGWLRAACTSSMKPCRRCAK